MSWDQIFKIAIIGTDRSQLPEPLLQDLAKQGIDTQKNQSHLALDALSLYHLQQRVGWQATSLSSETSSRIPSDEHICSPSMMQYFQQTAHGYYKDVLPEWVALCQQKQCVIAPASLPAAFQKALKDNLFWECIKPCVGNAGHWLLEANKDWKKLLETPKKKKKALIATEKEEEEEDPFLVLKTIQLLKEQMHFPAQSSDLVAFLQSKYLLWTPELTSLLIQRIDLWTQDDAYKSNVTYSDVFFKNILQTIVCQCDTRSITMLPRQLPDQIHPNWQAPLQSFYRTLAFRVEMNRAFEL